jgi:hypothetical protein
VSLHICWPIFDEVYKAVLLVLSANYYYLVSQITQTMPGHSCKIRGSHDVDHEECFPLEYDAAQSGINLPPYTSPSLLMYVFQYKY